MLIIGGANNSTVDAIIYSINWRYNSNNASNDSILHEELCKKNSGMFQVVVIFFVCLVIVSIRGANIFASGSVKRCCVLRRSLTSTLTEPQISSTPQHRRVLSDPGSCAMEWYVSIETGVANPDEISPQRCEVLGGDPQWAVPLSEGHILQVSDSRELYTSPLGRRHLRGSSSSWNRWWCNPVMFSSSLVRRTPICRPYAG